MRKLAKGFKLARLKKTTSEINDFIYGSAWGNIDPDRVLYVHLNFDNFTVMPHSVDLSGTADNIICIKKIDWKLAECYQFGVCSGNGKVGYNDIKYWAVQALYAYTLALAGWDIRSTRSARLERPIFEAFVSGSVMPRDMVSAVSAGVELEDIFA